MAFFKIEVNQAVNLQKEMFFAQCWQQGNLLMSYRKTREDEKFTPAEFNITLVAMDPTVHTFVKSKRSYNDFSPSLILSHKDRPTLKAGAYMLIVDVRWNSIAENNPILKEILISVSSTAEVWV